MSANQNCIGVWILFHSFLQTVRQILLVGCVLNDGYAQRVIIPEVADFASAFTNAFDLLEMLDLEAGVGAKVTLD